MNPRITASGLLCLIIAAMALSTATSTRAQTYTNPIAAPAADPFITYVNGNYYLLYTNLTGPNITIQASSSLSTLRGAPQVNVYNPGVFFESPELYTFNGLWYIYYTAYPNSCDVLESDSNNPLGSYHFKAQLTNNTYDSSILQMPGGQLYLMGSTYGSLVIQPMSNPYTVSGGQSTLAVIDQPWESGVIEAPQALWHNGQLDILYASGGYNLSNYAEGALHFNGGSVTDRGAYSKLGGPLFTGNPGAGVNDAAVASPFQSPDGTQTYFCYSDYTAQGAPPTSRNVLAQPMSFDAANNPVFGPAIGPGQPINLPSGDPNGRAATSINGNYWIAAATTGNALDCVGCANSNGTPIDLWPYWGGPCQQWNITPNPNGTYSIRNLNADGTLGRSLDCTGCNPNDGTNIELWDFWGGPCQQWVITKQADGNFSIASAQAKSNGVQDVLDGFGCSGANGTKIQLWTWDGGGCQQEWKFIPIGTSGVTSGHNYALTNEAGGLNLDDPNGTNVWGTKVQLFPANNATAQNWTFNLQGNGAYNLINQAGGLALDDPNGLGQGTQQQLWPSNGATAQQWVLNKQADGSFTLTNVATGLNLDDPAGSNQAGTHLQLWPANGASAQNWRLSAK